jgi:uncharacterized membrane protein YeaQ/YmgE (transglycosylase-associated protein family)
MLPTPVPYHLVTALATIGSDSLSRRRRNMGSVIGTIFSGLVAGVIIGPLARLVLPGRQNISFIMTVVIGAIGAVGGGLIYHSLGGGDTSGIDWIKLFVEVAVAAILVVVYGSIRSSNR